MHPTRLVRSVRFVLPCLLAGVPPVLAATPVEDLDAHAMDRITVSADPLGNRAVEDMTRPVTVVEGQALERRRAGTVGELVEGLPGVANSDFGPGVGRPTVRGQQGSRVRVLEDGLRTADVSGEGADHAVAVDPWRATRVEVLRGPATLLYGGGAAGGVIDLITGRFDPHLPDAAGGVLAGSYGGNGEDRQARAELALPAGEGGVVRADYGWRRSGDFDIRGFQRMDQEAGYRGRLQNSSIRSDAASVTGLLVREGGHVGLGLSRWSSDYGIPEVFDPMGLCGPGQDEYERVSASFDRVDLRSELFSPLPGVATLRLKAAHTRFEQEETEFVFSREDGRLEDEEVEVAFRNRETEARLDLVHVPLGGWQGVLGLHWHDRDFVAFDPEDPEAGFYVRPNRTRSAALVLLEEYDFGRTRLELGARIERERSRPAEVAIGEVPGIALPDGSFLPLPESLPTRSSSPLSFSAGLVGPLAEGQVWRVSASRSQRTPSPEQRYAFGRHPAAGTFEVGDPLLREETYRHFEAGVEGGRGRFDYSLTLFDTRADDYVYLASEDDGSGDPVFVNDLGQRPGEGETGACGPDDGGDCRFRNRLVFNHQADARFHGAELALGLRLSEGPVATALRASADRVYGRLRTGGDLPRITPSRYGLGLDTAWGDWSLGLDLRRVAAQRRVAGAESPTDGFTLLSLDLRWTPAALGGNTELFLRGRNLLNADGRLHQSFFKDQAPIVGRALGVGVRVRFGG